MIHIPIIEEYGLRVQFGKAKGKKVMFLHLEGIPNLSIVGESEIQEFKHRLASMIETYYPEKK